MTLNGYRGSRGNDKDVLKLEKGDGVNVLSVTDLTYLCHSLNIVPGIPEQVEKKEQNESSDII